MTITHDTLSVHSSLQPYYPAHFGRPLCSVPGCFRLHCARGLCQQHYDADRRARVPVPTLTRYGLSPAEVEVSRLFSAGLSNKEIAAARGVSYWTIANQLTAIYHKTGDMGRGRTMNVLRAALAELGMDCGSGAVQVRGSGAV